MLIKALKHILLFFLIVAFQISIVPNLPFGLNNLNYLIVILIFISVVYKFYWGVAYGVMIGIVLDLYSLLPFGCLMLAILVTQYLVYKVYEHFLTNKSYYSLISLSVIGILIYNTIIYFYQIIYKVLQSESGLIRLFTLDSFYGLLGQVFYGIILVSIMFFVSHHTSQKFRAVFIDTIKQ